MLEAPSAVPAHAFWFGEDQACYVITARDADRVMQLAKTAAVPITRLGATGGRVLAFGDERPLPVANLIKRFEEWLPAYIAGSH